MVPTNRILNSSDTILFNGQQLKMVNTRICGLSSNPKIFREAASVSAHDKSAYRCKIDFPPFNLASSTYIGREFLQLLDTHFSQKVKRKTSLKRL